MSVDSPWKVLGLVNEMIRHAETKAAAVLAGAGVAGALIYQLVKDKPDPSAVFIVTAALAAMATLVSSASAAAALIPRLAHRDPVPSLIYFQQIASAFKTVHAYAAALEQKIDADDLLAEVTGQIFSNSKIARAKFFWARWSLSSLFPAIGLIGLLALLSL